MSEADPGHERPVSPPQIVRSSLPRIEFGRSKRGDVAYYAALVAASILSWLVALLPDPLVTSIARFVGWVSFVTSKGFRDNVASNLSHIYNVSKSDPLVRTSVRGVFRTNALNIVDLLRVPHMNEHDYARQLSVDPGSWEVLDNAMASGSGAILITAHLGPFDLVGSALRTRGYPLSALTARTTNRIIFHGITFLRSSHDMRVIEASSGGLRDIIRLLQRGEMVLLLSDRDFFLSGRDAIFFGEPTTLPIGAVRLARDTGAPIIPFFAYREGKRTRMTVRPPISVSYSDHRDADIEDALKVVAIELEQAIGKAPDQWVLFQRVWPDDNRATD